MQARSSISATCRAFRWTISLRAVLIEPTFYLTLLPDLVKSRIPSARADRVKMCWLISEDHIYKPKDRVRCGWIEGAGLFSRGREPFSVDVHRILGQAGRRAGGQAGHGGGRLPVKLAAAMAVGDSMGPVWFHDRLPVSVRARARWPPLFAV